MSIRVRNEIDTKCLEIRPDQQIDMVLANTTRNQDHYKCIVKPP